MTVSKSKHIWPPAKAELAKAVRILRKPVTLAKRPVGGSR